MRKLKLNMFPYCWDTMYVLPMLYKISQPLPSILFQITDLQHSVLSPLSFRLDYKRGTTTTPTMFQRQVRMQVNISDITDTVDSEGLDAGGDRPARAGSNGDRGSHHGGPAIPVHAIMFTLLSGTSIDLDTI